MRCFEGHIILVAAAFEDIETTALTPGDYEYSVFTDDDEVTPTATILKKNKRFVADTN